MLQLKPTASTGDPRNRTWLAWTLAGLPLLIAWDASGKDLALAQLFGSEFGFPFRDHWFFVQVLHESTRRLGWAVVVLLAIGVWWPRGVLRQLQCSERLQLASSTLLALAVISIFKNTSTTSCPWDLVEFGGVARHVSHWALGIQDGGSGRCFPAGHASAGFAFLGGYFVLRRRHPRTAGVWLGTSLLAGFILGSAQQVRGAHFMSHTLWTAWLCWTAGGLWDMAFQAWRNHTAFQDSTSAALEAPGQPTRF